MSQADINRLIQLVRRLRGPGGCPWDQEQKLGDLRAYLLEEAHELAAAIDSGDSDELEEELGDVLFQAAFIAELVAEGDEMVLARAIERVHSKMVERHPHVFGDLELADRAAVNEAWEKRKLRESGRRSHLAGVSESLPALLAAYRMTQKAAGVGFDWANAQEVLEAVREETDELAAALAAGDKEAARDEIGDLLFSIANFARRLEIDPEAALAGTNRKFRRRFRYIEEKLEAGGSSLDRADLETMDTLWNEAKATESSRKARQSQDGPEERSNR